MVLKVPTFTDNKTTREFAGATSQRELAAAKQAAARANERAVANAHMTGGGGPKAAVAVDRVGQQDGTVSGGG